MFFGPLSFLVSVLYNLASIFGTSEMLKDIDPSFIALGASEILFVSYLISLLIFESACKIASDSSILRPSLGLYYKLC